MSQLLLTKISAVRTKHSSVSVFTGIALAVIALIVGLAVGMLLDWWLDLPRWVRAAFLAIDVAMAVTLLVMYALVPIWSGPDDDAIALKVEDANPQFATRLIAAIQLGRPGAVPAGASRALAAATIHQAETMSEAVDFTQVIRTERLTKYAIIAGLVLLGGLTALAWGRKDGVSTDLLARAFLSNTPVPRKTRIDVVSGHLKIARGDNAVLTAKARGVIPTSGEIEIKFDSGRRQIFPVNASAEDYTAFTLKLENAQDSFNYRVRKLGDSTSDWYRVDVLVPPAVTQLEVQQVFPPYTQRGTVSRSLGDLSILSGSRLLLKVTSNNPIRPDLPNARAQNVVHLVNSDNPEDVRLTVDPKDPRVLTADVPMPPKTSGFSIHLHDVNDLRSRDPAVYRVDLVPDKEPTVRVTYPERKEELVTRIATLDIGFDAADDYGIAKLSLKYKIDDGPEQTVPLDIAKPGDPQPKRLHNRFAWKIAKLTPRSATQPTLEGSTVEYWLEAEDNNNVTGPGKGESEHFAARIVSEAEKRAEILARLGASIQDVQRGVEDEQELHKKLGDLILERTPE
jgi:hypothetical protein